MHQGDPAKFGTEAIIERLTRVETLDKEHFDRLSAELFDLKTSVQGLSSRVDEISRKIEKVQIDVSRSYLSRSDFWKILALAMIAGGGTGSGLSLIFGLL